MSEQHDEQHDDGHILPVGKRRDDPPPKHWRWRLGLTVAKYPVQVAILLALIILAVPMVMLISANGDLRASQKTLRQAVVASQTSRSVTGRVICDVTNENGRANNGQTETLKEIIVGSVKQSKRFEATYRKLGLPPYPDRLRQAEQIARRLDRFTVRKANCADLQRRIEHDIALTMKKR